MEILILLLEAFLITFTGKCTNGNLIGSMQENNRNAMYGCYCVPSHMCTDNDAAVNGDGLLDLRYEQRLCKNYFEVCCDNPITDQLAALPLPVAIPQLPPQLSQIPQHSQMASIPSVPVSQPSHHRRGGCGYPNPMGLDFRITGSGSAGAEQTQFGELPWTVVILYRAPSKINSAPGGPDGDAASPMQQQQGKIMYKCGGSLIHERVVLTAAHCVAPKGGGNTNGGDVAGGQWTIRAGEWNTNNQEEVLPHQDRVVEEILIHPQYQPGSLKSDLALLILATAVTRADNIGFICLPLQATPDANLPPAGTRCLASGWGKNAFRRGRHSSILRKVELPLVDRDVCVQALRETRLGKYYQLHRSFLCAGGEPERDTCKGDGGSPLVCSIGTQGSVEGHGLGKGGMGRFVQVGIVSWGIGCGESNTPGVYVNVGLYRGWIDEQLEGRGLDTSTYKYE